jgi:hypothetical protein
MVERKSVLVSIVNYGEEQLEYLQKVVDSIKSFKKYDTTVLITSNVNLDGVIHSADHFVYITELPTWELLPLMARRVLVNYRNKFDYYLYTENDHLWQEHHVDNYIRYESILPVNYISGLIQYETDGVQNYYPAYHAHYDWDYNSVEEFGGLKFAQFTNQHQASFLISNDKFETINNNFNLNEFYSQDQYSIKCKVNTEIYKYSRYKKVICISEFDDNLIHHLPNVYIHGDGKVRIKQRSDSERMNNALKKLLQ